jgi:hypothetical protein
VKYQEVRKILNNNHKGMKLASFLEGFSNQDLMGNIDQNRKATKNKSTKGIQKQV